MIAHNSTPSRLRGPSQLNEAVTGPGHRRVRLVLGAVVISPESPEYALWLASPSFRMARGDLEGMTREAEIFQSKRLGSSPNASIDVIVDDASSIGPSIGPH